MESRLNPDAPEFRPGVTTVQCPYNSVESTIVSSSVMPHNWYGIFPDYYSIAYNMTENIFDCSNNVMTRAGPAQHTIQCANVSTVSTWNNQHNLSQIKSVSPALITQKKILKPQINFKDLPNNTTNIWVPKIKRKPNAKKPLKFITIYDENGKTISIEHPYKYELETYVPPKHLIDPDCSPPLFPYALEATPLRYINTEAQLDQLVAHLTSVEEFAIDVEHHAYRTYQGITCLIQISTNEGGDFIIDTLSIREHVHKLNEAFTDPKIIKVLHGASNDVIWLQRDFGVYIVGLFDTYHAAKLLKISGLSLKNLLRIYCNINIDKKYQVADWRIRPLPAEMIKYARLDTHYLLYIWRSMKQQLLDSDQGKSTLLCSVFEMSTKVCANTYMKPVVDANSYMPLYTASRKKFNSRQLTGLQMLYLWRDTNARLLDESPAYVLPDEEMMTLAEKLPTEIEDVAKCCASASSYVNQNIGVIHNMISYCREIPVNPGEDPKPAGIRPVVNQVPTSTNQVLTLATPCEGNAEEFEHLRSEKLAVVSNTVEPSKTGKTPKDETPCASKTGWNPNHGNAHQKEFRVKSFTYTNIRYRKGNQSATNPSDYSKNKKINKFK